MKSILNWIRNHLIVIIISVVILCGVIIVLPLATNNQNEDLDANSNTLEEGTYNCEFRYNGKRLDDEEVVRDYIQHLATYESSIEIDKVNISDFNDDLSDIFGTIVIVKKDNVVKLNLPKWNDQVEFALYNISNNQLKLNKDWFDEEDENALNVLEKSFNKFVHIEETKDNFTFKNFGVVLITPTIYNNSKNNISSDGTININYDQYTNLGDLVCGNNIDSSKNDDENENKLVDNETIYEDIITQNRKFLLGMITEPPKGNINYAEPILLDDTKVHLAYAFNDLNADGKDELIIGQNDSYYCNDHQDCTNVFSIYTYDDNGKVEALALPEGTSNFWAITILEDGYFEVEYGHQNNQRRSIYGNIQNNNEVVDDWNKLGNIITYELSEKEPDWQLYLEVYKNGKLLESHKNVTWDAWGELANKPLADITSKRAINLNNLNWKYILPLD